MLVIKGDAERRVVADAELQLLGGIGGVGDGQGVVHRPALQPEGAGQNKIKREALCLALFIRAQLQPDGVTLGAEQGVLHVPGKAMLTAGVGLALMGEGPAGQLARPGEKDGGMALPDSRVGLPEHLLPGGIFQADCFGTMGIHGQGQEFVVNGCLHDSSLLFIC